MDEFCQGWGELDQLGDVASDLMNAKFPGNGYNRVSKLKSLTNKATLKMLNVGLHKF